MTLYQLKVFVTVARLKSYTLASEELGVRQPSVSLIIHSLERQLGIKLFERLGNKVHLTAGGEELFRHGDEIIAKAEGIKEEMQEFLGLQGEKVSVGGSALAGAFFLVAAVAKFKKERPQLDVIVKIDKSENLERMLLQGRLDVAIMSWASTSPLLFSQPYVEDEIAVIAPPTHSLTQRRSVPLELIAKEPLVMQKTSRAVRDPVEERFVEKGFPLAGVLDVDAPFAPKDTIKSAVASGVGISFLSKCYVLADVEAGRIKLLNVPELNLKRTLYIVARKNLDDSSMGKTFIDFLQSYRNEL